MNLVDSSGWLEYLADGPNAPFFEEALVLTTELIVPTLCLFEVFKTVLRQRGEDAAVQAAALMGQGRVVDLSAPIALTAARIGHERKIPAAASIIAATAALSGATVWTQDEHFLEFPNVRYVPKTKG